MKTIEIQQQPILSLGRTIQIALTGVRYRLFRASVTVAVIAVAMAFLMNILSESLIKMQAAGSARDQIDELHRADKWVARLSVPQSPEEIIEGLAAAGAGSPTLQEAAALSGLKPEDVETFRAPAARAAAYLRFMANLNYGRRRVLVGDASGTDLFDRLREPGSWARFTGSLKAMKAIRFVTDTSELKAFLDEWPHLREFAGRVRAGQAHAIARLEPALAGRSVLQALEDAEGEFGRSIRAAGFALDDAEAASLAGQARLASDTRLIEDTINNPDMRQAVAAREDVLPGEVTVDRIWAMLRDPGTAEWYLRTMQENQADPGRIGAARLTETARRRAHGRLLVRAEMITRETGGGFLGIGRRMTWLAFVSMLVCVVGIANAMLMSVTERFREIATLKCLGALDAFIMLVFLIEACVLGLVGGVAGSLMGLLLGVARMGLSFRGLLAQALPVGALLLAALVSICVGIVLAAVAAVYPSLRAARLAPMEAMRIE